MRTCKACHEDFPATGEFFVTVTVKAKGWTGLASECRACRNKRYAPYYAEHREGLIARAKVSTKKRRERPEVREAERIGSRDRKRVVLADPVKRQEHNARAAKWRRDNPEGVKLFKHESRAAKAERTMRRYARNAQATPAWADRNKIACIYAIAALLTERTGIEHQVDHYYPIKGRRSCGLHVHQNMRVITAAANQSKGNREPEWA
jgi:hypothetical protein